MELVAPNPTPAPTPSIDPTITSPPDPSPLPTTVIVELVQQADPAGLIVAIIAVVIAALAAGTGVYALWQNYQMRTKPRMEFQRLHVNSDPFRWGSRENDDPNAPMRWWTETAHKLQVRNWGNGIAYDVRLHADDGMNQTEAVLGNLGPGESAEPEYKRTVGPGHTPKAWVTWHEYPGPVEKTYAVPGGWGG